MPNNETDQIVDAYLKACEKVFTQGVTAANVARVEAIEAANPWVIDEAYRRGREKEKFQNIV
jgi:hypothetical protein